MKNTVIGIKKGLFGKETVHASIEPERTSGLFHKKSFVSVSLKKLFKCSTIIIPDGVTTIGESAFEGFTNLKKIVLPDSVTAIGKHAFKGCKNLTEVNIGQGHCRIHKTAFDECPKIQSLNVSRVLETFNLAHH